jgi:isopenicillin-N N-acyltransferase-like protein
MFVSVSEHVTPTYQHVVVRGTRFERGFSHGQQASLKIKKNIEYYKASGKIPPW